MSNTRVFIGRLNHRARESDVERFFKGYGKLRDISLKNGYGFVQFDDARDAEDAVYELNNREICGERVTIEHAKGTPRSGGGGYRGGGGFGRRDSYRDSYRDRGYDRGGYGGGQRRTNYYDSRAIGKYGPPVRTKYRVIVENLSSRVSWQDLKDYLREAGEVSYADAHKHRQNEGVVDFATYDDMKRAIDKMDDTELNGRRIKLVPDKSYSSKSRSRSRSRGRSRSRSHSRGRSRSRSRSARRSKSRSRSRSRSRGGSRSRSRSRSRRDSRSRSRSRSGSKTRSRSRSQERRSRSVEEKRSRSKSRSPAQDNGDASPKQSKQEESEEKAMSRSPSPRD